MYATHTRSDSRSAWFDAHPSRDYAAISDPARIAHWWGPAGFSNMIHRFDFRQGGSWRLTMHGPDGSNYPSESRFTRLIPDRLFEIEHRNGHDFVLTLSLTPQGNATGLHWQQTFDTVDHCQHIAAFVATANAQNLERLAAEVLHTLAPGGQA